MLAIRQFTLSCPGPAPIWSGDELGKPLAPRPTGDFVFNAPSSMLFAPVVTVPLMSVGGMPVGVQLTGQQHDDARVTGTRAVVRATLEESCRLRLCRRVPVDFCSPAKTTGCQGHNLTTGRTIRM